MIPSIAQKSLRNANLIACTLKLARVAAQSFIMAVRTMRRSIAHETLLDALASVAAEKYCRLSKAQIKVFLCPSPKLFCTASWTIELIAFVWAIVLAITPPRRRNAIAIMINGVAVTVEGRCACKVIGTTSRLRATSSSIFQEHQTKRTRAHLVGFAVVHRRYANMRTFVLLRCTKMILNDFRFWMPDGDNIRDVSVFLLESNAFAADCRLLESELLVKPINDIGKGCDRVNLIDV